MAFAADRRLYLEQGFSSRKGERCSPGGPPGGSWVRPRRQASLAVSSTQLSLEGCHGGLTDLSVSDCTIDIDS